MSGPQMSDDDDYRPDMSNDDLGRLHEYAKGGGSRIRADVLAWLVAELRAARPNVAAAERLVAMTHRSGREFQRSVDDLAAALAEPRAAEPESASDAQCPTCESTAPHLHPAMQHEGEVQVCRDAFHRVVTAQNTPEKIARAQRLVPQPPTAAPPVEASDPDIDALVAELRQENAERGGEPRLSRLLYKAANVISDFQSWKAAIAVEASGAVLVLRRLRDDLRESRVAADAQRDDPANFRDSQNWWDGKARGLDCANAIIEDYIRAALRPDGEGPNKAERVRQALRSAFMNEDGFPLASDGLIAYAAGRVIAALHPDGKKKKP